MAKYIGKYRGEFLKTVSCRTMRGGELYESQNYFVEIEPTTRGGWRIGVYSKTKFDRDGNPKLLYKKYIDNVHTGRKYVERLGFEYSGFIYHGGRTKRQK